MKQDEIDRIIPPEAQHLLVETTAHIIKNHPITIETILVVIGMSGWLSEIGGHPMDVLSNELRTLKKLRS